LSAAEKRYGIPTGLLQAIGLVESGRRDETTGKRESWPWAINAEGESHFFDTKEQAVGWVRQAQNRGIRSIDVGCGQINLVHHPTAFSTMEKAFDPTANADYAARFLKELRDTSAAGNWMTAVGFYHSQTPELAEPYRRQVQAALASGGGQTAAVDVPAAASETSSPFGANRRTQLAAPLRAEPARVMQAAPPVAGRSLVEYRATPIRLARVIGTAGFRTQE